MHMLRALSAKRYRAYLRFAFERDWLKTDVAPNTIQMSAIALFFFVKMETMREHVSTEQPSRKETRK